MQTLTLQEIQYYKMLPAIDIRGNANDISNQEFGKITPIKPIGKSKNKHIIWFCKCNCGNYKLILQTNLISKKTLSCGCIQQSIARKIRLNVNAGNSLAEKCSESIGLWDYKLNKDTPYNINYSSRQIRYFKCVKYSHSYYLKCYEFFKGFRCPYCSKHKILQGFNDLKTANPDWLVDWDYEANKLGPENYTPLSSKKIYCKCHICGLRWQVTISNRTQGNGCPKCNASKLEKETAQILNKFNIKYEQEYKFGILGTGGGQLRVDFFLPDHNTIIECQGIQHYDENKWYDKKSSLITQKHDKIKRKYAKKNNIKLIEIPYTDFDNIDKILINNLKLENYNEN
jgi:hypothetical protein